MKRAAAAALVLVVGVVVAQRRTPKGPAEATAAAADLRTYRITFGETNGDPKTWDGSIEVAGGEVVSLEGWRFSDGDRIEGKAWKLATRVANLEDQRRGPTPAGQPAIRRLIEAGVVATIRGPASAIRVTTPQGDFEFTGIDYGRPAAFLGGNVTVERVPEAERLTDDTYEDDYPAPLVTPWGELWVAWVGYRDKADFVLVRRGKQPAEIVSGPGDHQHPAIAEDSAGRVWVVWSENLKGAWHLRARRFQNSRWSAVEQLTSGEGPNISPVLAADKSGDLHLAWQGFRNRKGEILLKTFHAGRWSNEVALSEGAGDNWDPAIAASPTGGACVAWDGYHTGSFQVYARQLRGGKPGALQQVGRRAGMFAARASVACDAQGRPWIAWEESGPNWGKDYAFLDDRAATALYQDRSIRVAFLAGDRWEEPIAQVQNALSNRIRRFHHLPSIAFDRAGRLWMILRVRTSAVNQREDYWASGGRWEFYATRLEGSRWAPAVWLPDSAGRNGMRAFLVPSRDERSMRAVWPADHRNWPMGRQGPLDLYTANLPADGPVLKAESRAVEPATAGAPSPHPNERADLRRIRDYRIELGGRPYRILRADLHRHTELSQDGAGDGSLEDLYRYEMNAAELDIGYVGDHQMGVDNEYNWWITQKSNDLYTVPGRFIGLYGYERSVWWPNGHRNVVWAERGKPVLKIGQPEAKGGVNSGPILYPYLKETGGIAMPHSTATEQGTDWRDNNSDLEPLVEIYQGFESSYEYAGAPRAWDPQRSKPIHQGQRPQGFLWNAWAKGLKYGVQASSDHVSTHTSYSNIITDDTSRRGLLDAMRARHTYASTDLIILDYRMEDPDTGPHLMGDIFATRSTPKIKVKIVGTGPIQKVDLVKNNKFIFTRSPGEREFAFEYADNEPPSETGEDYYYVRVIQSDGELAWSSPIWVRRER